MVAIRCSLIRQFDGDFWRSGINPKNALIQNRRGTKTSPYSKIRRITSELHRIPHNQSVRGWWDFYRTSGNSHLDGVLTV